MKIAAAKTLFVIVLVVLLVLLAASAFVWWRTSHGQGGVDAQQKAAAELKTLRAGIESSGVSGFQKENLESDVDEQLDALNRTAVDKAEADESRRPTDLRGLTDEITRSSKTVYDLASTDGLSSDEAATLVSIAVNQWGTVQLFNGSLGEVSDASSTASAQLKDMTGLGQNQALDAKGMCPAMSDDAKDKASAGSASGDSKRGSSKDSKELSDILTGLYSSSWAESYFQAREDVDGTAEDTAKRLDVAASVHSSQLQQLRAGLDQACESVPQPHAAYDLPDDTKDPGKVMTGQADHLAHESMALIRTQDPSKSGVHGTKSWTAWGARSLALNTVVSSQVSGDIPALPGIS